MASIRRAHKGKRKWRVRWRHPDGRQTERSFHNRRNAEDFCRRVEDALAMGQGWRIVAQLGGLEECVQQYLRLKSVRWLKELVLPK